MTKLLLLLVLVMTVYLTEGRHVHPRSVVRIEEEGKKSEDIDGISINFFQKLTPNRLVPFNSEDYFKSMEPCEEGLERDILGVCREVWD